MKSQKAVLFGQVILFILFLQSPVFAIVLDAIYTGPSGGSWNTASHWDINVVPCNQGSVEFNVTIPAGKTVVRDIPGDCQINDFTLGDNTANDAQLILNADCNLTVLDGADIYDFINGNGGNFTSINDSDSLDGTRNRIWAHNGSIVTINDNSFVATGLNNSNYTILSADGASSEVNLSWTTSLNDAFANNSGFGSEPHLVHTISATDSGQIDLSGLATITGPGDTERLDIIVNTGGGIAFDSLATVSGSSTNGTRFLPTGPSSYVFPALATISHSTFSVNGTTISLLALETVSKTLFSVSGGGEISDDGSGVWTYSAASLNWGSYTLFSSAGANSLLDLSGMSSLNDAFANNSGFGSEPHLVHTISATDSGQIDLSGLTSITGPGDDERLDIIVNTGGNINLDSLATINGGGGGAYTRFYLTDASSLSVPALETVSNTVFSVSGGGEISDDGSGAWTYSAASLNWSSYTLFSSSGVNSLLDLSGMSSLNDAFANNSGFGSEPHLVHTISATDSGQIDLSGLTTITGPGDTERLDIIVNTGGGITFDSLATVSGSSTRGTRFLPTGPSSYVFPALATISHSTFSVNGTIISLLALETVSNTLFSVGGGGEISDDGSGVWTYSAASLNWGSYTLFSSSGVNSLLDLSGMSSLNDAFANNSGFGSEPHLVHTISATDSGQIDLSGLTTITGPGDTERLNITINTAGNINLSSLGTITGGSGKIYITMDTGSDLLGGDVVFNEDVTVSLNGGSYLYAKSVIASQSVPITMNDSNDMINIAGDFNLSDKIFMDSNDGSLISLGGDLTYTHIIEDNMMLGGAILHCTGSNVQRLEVGGLDVDVLTGVLTNDNFVFGQMIVGQCDEPSLVQLVEEIDNGNRASSNPEALYLFGLDDGSDGLRILGGSILLIGDLNVYAMIDGTMTRIRDLFGPSETVIYYTYEGSDGYIMLGDPNIGHAYNLVLNGGFENGVNPPDEISLFATVGSGVTDIDNWTIAGDGIDWCNDALFEDNDPCGVLSVDLSGTPEGCGVISQEIATEAGHRYFVWFDMSFNPVGNVYGQAGEKTVEIRAAGDSKQFTLDSTIDPGEWPADPNLGWTVPWTTMTYSFIANDTTTTLEFACMDEPATAFGPAIDNVVVIEGSELFSLIPGDLNGNDIVNYEDLRIFCLYWLSADCNGLSTENCWCEGADLDKDGDVDFPDFAIFAMHWLNVQGMGCSLTISSTAGGVVTSPGEGLLQYECGTIEPVTAETESCYEFTGWSGTAVDLGKVSDPCSASTTVLVDGDYTLRANFQIIQYTLSISSSAGGNVTGPGEGLFIYDCGSEVSLTTDANDFYHFSGWSGTGVGQVTDANAASTTIIVDANYTLDANFAENPIEAVIENPLDSDPGWSCAGQWGYGVPTGGGGTEYGYPDPTSGCSGSNVYGVNLNGDYDTALGGPYELIAGPFDLTGHYETSLEFCSWLNTDFPDYVMHSVQMSQNGTDWTMVWQHTGRDEIVSNAWSVESYDISTQADNQSTVYIKWSYEIGDERAYPYSGWNIDDIKVMGKAK